MAFSESDLEALKNILSKVCAGYEIVPRAVIFEQFKQETKSSIEQYKFNLELSSLIRNKKITGFEIKVGCKGGVMKTEPIERITLHCSYGQISGCVPQSRLEQFLSHLKR